ncbi:unnamed protein product [Brachionus calyciflorus]|uniref:Uncharacterized protein n=1 Tax=Brachionus calyciflorus TaxID=104777 RepID=A0A814K275_9BILA|nr:unnamed protein product [Brachionus calyciflorus]
MEEKIFNTRNTLNIYRKKKLFTDTDDFSWNISLADNFSSDKTINTWEMNVLSDYESSSDTETDFESDCSETNSMESESD